MFFFQPRRSVFLYPLPPLPSPLFPFYTKIVSKQWASLCNLNAFKLFFSSLKPLERNSERANHVRRSRFNLFFYLHTNTHLYIYYIILISFEYFPQPSFLNMLYMYMRSHSLGMYVCVRARVYVCVYFDKTENLIPETY